MNRTGMRRAGARPRRAMAETRAVRPGHPLATFEFVLLRKGTCCVPAVEIVAGSHSVVDEVPDGVDRAALGEWLAAHGLSEITRHKGGAQ